MRVAFCLRSNHERVKGGDLVQVRSTAAALRAAGVEVELLSDPRADLGGFDLVHAFNSPWFAETQAFFANARRHGKPVAFSTIYWPKGELTVGMAESPKVRAARRLLGGRGALAAWDAMVRVASRALPRAAFGMERALFAQADVLLPNSESELRAIERAYGLRGLTHRVVRNAIDPELFTAAPDGGRSRHVLSVGRVENRKNTLALVEACREAGADLVLIGDAGGDEYARACLERAHRYGFRHLPAVAQPELVAHYYEAAVYAQVSWYETPGLATMEAACAGCSVVSTDRGSAREYFGDAIEYCDPWSPASIRAAVERALARPADPALRRRVMTEYTWSGAARDTIGAYEALLGR